MRYSAVALILPIVVEVYAAVAVSYDHFYFQRDNAKAEQQSCRFLICDTELLAHTAYQRLWEGSAEGIHAAVAYYSEVLARDPASAERWCDLGEALLESGRKGQAKYCLGRALTLAPHAPAILIRAANSHFRIGEPDAAMRCSSQVLKQIPDYDEAIFASYLRFGLGVDTILLRGLPEDRRAAQSFLRFLMAQGELPGAQQCWNWMISHTLTDDRVAHEYVTFLAQRSQYDAARDAWVQSLGQRRGDYPDRNRLFNGGFEQEPTGGVFDWSIQNLEGVTAGRDSSIAKSGAWSLRIRFEGKENVAYSHVSQRAVVEPGRRYRFRAYVLSQDVTTDQGIGFRIFDVESPGRLDFTIANILGTQYWQKLEKVFAAPPQTRLLGIQVIRRPSLKFDNKISGTVWIDDVSLVP